MNPPEMRQTRFLGRLAGLTQLVFAGLIAAVSAFASSGDPDFVPRWAVLFLWYALPGVIGLIGVQADRPWLVLVAGLTTAIGASIAMSGVTLIFLVPAILFLFGAARLARSTPSRRGDGWARGLAQLGLAAAIAVLVVGAGAALLVNTDSACWTEYRTAAGVRIELLPFMTDGVQVPDGATSVSCSTGLITARGVGLAGLLGGAALGLAAIGARRRGPGSSESGATGAAEASAGA
jgi:hypothetical protein